MLQALRAQDQPPARTLEEPRVARGENSTAEKVFDQGHELGELVVNAAQRPVLLLRGPAAAPVGQPKHSLGGREALSFRRPCFTIHEVWALPAFTDFVTYNSGSARRPQALRSWLIPQGHRPRTELQPVHEPQVDELRQPREQRRPMARDPGMHHELVL